MKRLIASSISVCAGDIEAFPTHNGGNPEARKRVATPKGAHALKEIQPRQSGWRAVDWVNARPRQGSQEGRGHGIPAIRLNNFFDEKQGADPAFGSARLLAEGEYKRRKSPLSEQR